MRKAAFGWAVLSVLACALCDCGSSDPPDTGSRECCQVRAMCKSCNCSTAEESAGLQDHKGACVNVLAAWDNVGCMNCSESNCMSSCH